MKCKFLLFFQIKIVSKKIEIFLKKVLTREIISSIIYLADALKESQPGTDKVPLES